MSTTMPAGGGAVPGERVGGGTVPGLKARVHPARSSTVGGQGQRPPRAVCPARMASPGMSPAASGQGATSTPMPTHDSTVSGAVPGLKSQG